MKAKLTQLNEMKSALTLTMNVLLKKEATTHSIITAADTTHDTLEANNTAQNVVGALIGDTSMSTDSQ